MAEYKSKYTKEELMVKFERGRQAIAKGVDFQIGFLQPDGGYIWDGYRCDAFHKQAYSWNLVGKAEYPVSEEFVFTDSVDLEKNEVTYSTENLLENIPAPEYGYQPQNTMVRIENGQVVAMDRIYTP